MDASSDNGRKVADRVLKKCEKLCEQTSLTLTYDIETIKKN